MTDVIPTINRLPYGAGGFEEDLPDPTTTIPCPPWCVVEHTEPGAFHAGPNLHAYLLTERPGGFPVRLWQQDSPEASPGVVVAGELLTAEQALELGFALVRAADDLRLARQETHR